jgi:hypothetical protein
MLSQFEANHFLEGANAQASRSMRKVNPYDLTSQAGIAWVAGWDAAAEKIAGAEQKEGPPW